MRFNNENVVTPMETTEATSLEIKVSLQNSGASSEEVRRFMFTGGSFNELVAKIGNVFALGDASGFVLKYKDEDGDFVTISSDEELGLLLKKTGSAGTLRLFLHPKNQIPSALTAPQPQGTAQPATSSGRFARELGNHHDSKRELKKALRETKQQFRQMKFEDKREAKKAWRELKKDFKCEKHDKFVARFVKHVRPEDGAEFAPTTPFTKTWRFRNDGEKPWPNGTRLGFIGRLGDRLGGPDYVLLDRQVNPGEEVDISVDLVAPVEPGRYMGYWRLQSEEGKKFGQRVWVQIHVTGSSSSSSSETSSDDKDADAPSNDNEEDKDKKKKDKKGGRKRHHERGDKKESKRKAKEEKEQQDLVKHFDALVQLDQMGFADKKKNLKLLNKFDGDLSKVTAKLAKKANKNKNHAKVSTTD